MHKGLVFPTAHLRAALPPPQFAEEVARIEAELDQIHPPWRQPLGRGRVGIVGSAGIEGDDARKARVKWLLQRRKHLYDGRDYDVVVTAYKGRGGVTKMMAHPIIPRERLTPEEVSAAARRSWLKPEEQVHQASIPQIADLLRVPVERVERALLDAPEGANLLAWARKKLQAADNGAPLPEKPKPARKSKLIVA